MHIVVFLVTVFLHLQFFFLFLIIPQVSLHVLYGFIIKLALDFMSLHVVVIVKNKMVKLLHSSLQVIQRHMPVFVEVKAQPFILNYDWDIFVVASDVLGHFLLVLLKNVHKERDVVWRLVVDDEELILERTVYFVIEDSEKLLSSFLHLVILLFIVDVLICNLVWSTLLYNTKSLFTSK